jgi:bacterioferritin
MLELGVAPNASQLRPVHAGRTLQELLLQDQVLEQLLVTHYRDATIYCARVGDQENHAFFEALLHEEQAHAAHLQEWLQELGVSP